VLHASAALLLLVAATALAVYKPRGLTRYGQRSSSARCSLVTGATKAAAGQVDGVELRESVRRAFRNVGEPIQVYAAVRLGERSPTGLPIGPVCRMAVDPWRGAGRLTHQGVEYCFCSLGCAGAFAQHPGRYTAGP
jgi:YHS domain-containing protein